MVARRKIWTDMNDARPGVRPPFAIESWTVDRDFMPPTLLQCKTDYGRNLETRHQEIFDDDHVCPGTLDMDWHIHLDEFGIEIATHYQRDAEGKSWATTSIAR